MSKLDPKAVAFFYEHAGVSWNPATETEAEGRMRGAIELARAERWAQRKGCAFEWNDDWGVGSHVAEFDCYDDEPSSCEFVRIMDANDDPLGPSLGCIDDATDAYRRVVEAELAEEAMGRRS